MTTPGERYRALVQLEWQLQSFAGERGRVSRTELREWVSAMLRHYPTKHDIDLLARRCPDILRDEQ